LDQEIYNHDEIKKININPDLNELDQEIYNYNEIKKILLMYPYYNEIVLLIDYLILETDFIYELFIFIKYIIQFI